MRRPRLRRPRTPRRKATAARARRAAPRPPVAARAAAGATSARRRAVPVAARRRRFSAGTLSTFAESLASTVRSSEGEAEAPEGFISYQVVISIAPIGAHGGTHTYATRGAGGGRPLGGPRAVSADADRESALYSELRKYLLLCCAVSHRINSNRRRRDRWCRSLCRLGFWPCCWPSPRPSIPRHSKTQGNPRYRAISHLPSPSRLSSLPSAFSSPFRVGSTYCQKTELHTMAARMSLPLSLASVDPSSS